MKIRRTLKLTLRCRGCGTLYTIATADLPNLTGWCEECQAKLVRLRKATRIVWVQ